MVKAIIELKDGIKIHVEGTPEEITRTKELVTAKKGKLSKKEKIKKQKKGGPLGRILELREENFFNKPRGITEIKQKLEEKTHYYPLSSLSPALIRLVRKQELRRLKKGGKWVWVKK